MKARQLTRQPTREARERRGRSSACCPRPPLRLRLPNSYFGGFGLFPAPASDNRHKPSGIGNYQLLGTSLLGYNFITQCAPAAIRFSRSGLEI